MKPLRATALVLLLGTASLHLPSPAHADEPRECTRYSPLNYCVEWETEEPGTPGDQGVSGPQPTCYWVAIPEITDPTIYVDMGIPEPTPGTTIIWQSWECSDGRVTFRFRWIPEPTPGDAAIEIRARIDGQLPTPVVVASPPVGTPAIIEVPSFAAVSNWSGTVTDSGCAGAICVTVSAVPRLRFSSGEPGSGVVECAGSGTTFNRLRPLAEQRDTQGACTLTYKKRTGVGGRPAAWLGFVSVVWSVSWQSNNGQSGVLPSITRSTAVPRAVQEVQTVVVGGSNP